MKKNVFYLMVIITVLCCFSSCKDDKDDLQEIWMIANLNAINVIRSNPEYKEIQSPGNEGSIYYKVLKAGDNRDTIRYTSMVSCYYKGWFVADYPKYNITTGKVFDQKLFDDGSPFITSVGTGVITGWKTALQHMVKGDKWEIWIPYELGYGRDDTKNSSGIVSIPGYSTLVFELEVIEVRTIDD